MIADMASLGLPTAHERISPAQEEGQMRVTSFHMMLVNDVMMIFRYFGRDTPPRRPHASWAALGSRGDDNADAAAERN